MILFKNISFICIFFAIFSFAEEGNNTNGFNKYMSPEGDVNPMSGTLALQKEIASISAGQMSAKFSLKYSGNVYNEVQKTNDEYRGGISGLGWSMGRSKIVCDNKNNTFLDDDVYYLETAEGNRYRIFEEKAWRKSFRVDYNSEAEKKWWIEGNPYWKVERIDGSAYFPDKDSLWEFVRGWKITDAEGVVHTYGDMGETNTLTGPTPNATEYDLAWLKYNDNGTEKSAFGLMEPTYGGTPSYYPVAWNLAREEALDGNYLEYKYNQVRERLYGYFAYNKMDQKEKWNPVEMYTKESYLEDVYGSNGARLHFLYENKGENQFFGEYVDDDGKYESPSDEGSDMFKEKIYRKYLSEVQIYGPSINGEANYIGKVSFCYSVLRQNTPYVKRLLSSVRYYDRKGIEIDYEEYTYYTDVNKSTPSYGESVPVPLGLLVGVKGKNCGWVEYEYRYESMGSGHIEELPLDSIYGQGRLENGTPYLVGRKGSETKIYTRILGRWVLSKTLYEGNAITKMDKVSIGDAGWFLGVIKDRLAFVFQWNGKEWQVVATKALHSRDGIADDFKVENVVAGPDYVLFMKIDDESRPGMNDGYCLLEFVWTKWGALPDDIKITEVDDGRSAVSKYNVAARKNHILVKYVDGSLTCTGNCVGFHVYTFKNGNPKAGSVFRDNGLDTDNKINLNGPFLADVGEGYHAWDRSRVIIYNWNGHDWFKQIRKTFDNKDKADIQAAGSDYFAVRYNENRHLRIFSFDNNTWNGNAYHDKLFNHQMTSGFYWIGVGTEDFFVTTRSYRRKWFTSVKEETRIKLYYHKNGSNWKAIDYGWLDGFKYDKKEMIVGNDWFLDKGATNYAWVWNGNEWKKENLSGTDYLGKASSGNVYSLGGNLLAKSSGGTTRILYKVNNSFTDEIGTFLLNKKTVYEPVADRIIEYTYSFLTNENSKNRFAYDEVSNSPLMDVMRIDFPDGKGAVKRYLCDLTDGVENVAVGSVCSEIQEGNSSFTLKSEQSNRISQKKMVFNRIRNEKWPYPIYVDQMTSTVEIARGLKTAVKNEYSESNGLLTKVTKKIGESQTVENYLYVSDLTGSSENEKKVVKALQDDNRLNVLAGSYACIRNCSSGTIVAASANGMSKIDGLKPKTGSTNQSDKGLYTITSTWKFTPKSKIQESTLRGHIKDIALNSKGNANWERQSLNSKYENKHVVETIEGPRNIKVASFYENSENGKMYGNAANCGFDEGLMLSGESCNVKNWSGCRNDTLSGSAKDVLNVSNADDQAYGHFSKYVIELTSQNTLTGTIPQARNGEYTFTAWLQYGSNPSNLYLTVNGQSQSGMTWDVRPSNLPADSIGKWKQIEWKGVLNGPTTISLSVKNEPGVVRLQDIRMLPSSATSTSIYWNEKWSKIETTVDSRGVGEYVGFDSLGRETEHYSETVEGDVYLSSRKEFVDGSCTQFPGGSNTLSSLYLNGRPQVLPTDGSRKATYVINDAKVSIDFSTLSKRDAVIYRIYPTGEDKEKVEWISGTCGSLCYPAFSFTPEKTNWTLEVNVEPLDDEDIYSFEIKKSENDWVEYGAFDGFADGYTPKYVNNTDLSVVAYKDKSGALFSSKYTGNQWNKPVALFQEELAEFTSYTGTSGRYLVYIPSKDEPEDFSRLEYPKVFRESDNKWYARDVEDKKFRAEGVAITDNQSGVPVMVFNKTAIIGLIDFVLPEKITSKLGYRHVDSLSAMIWNDKNKRFENLGNLPVFDMSKAVVDRVKKKIDFYTGDIKSYHSGAINGSGAVSSDIVVGPDGKLYVAYIGSSDYFKWCEQLEACPGDVPFVYVKRLYNASEVSAASKDIWAGVSQINGTPLYQGDILSWTDNEYDAIEGAKKLKLAYDGTNLYLAVSYELLDDAELEEYPSSSSNSVSSSSSSYVGSLTHPTYALSVFKGSIVSNITVNGKNYSKYLKWEPLKDVSVTGTFMAKNLEEEQSRIIYMNENDDFEFLIKNKVPYILFRNMDNRNAISVISYKDQKWRSVGNPGFAFPEVSESSANLGVDANGLPFVAFKADDSWRNYGRNNKLIGMRYNPEGASDLTLKDFKSEDSDFNKSCAFRPYILHYIANLKETDKFVFSLTPNSPEKVKEIQVFLNKEYKKSLTTFTGKTEVVLENGLNELEIRLVGAKGNTLSYDFDLYKKFEESVGLYAVGLMADINFQINENGEMLMGIVPKSIKKDGTIEFDIHFSANWELLLGEDNLIPIPQTVTLSLSDLPMKGKLINKKTGKTIPIELVNMKDVEDPSQLIWNQSSSSGYSSAGRSSSSYNSSNSRSSSSYSSSNSQSSSSYNSSNSQLSSSYSSSGDISSSSSVLNDDMSTTVPIEIRNLTTSRVFATKGMDVADNTVIKGDIFAGRDIDIGVTARVDGSIYSGKDVLLRNRAHVIDVYYSVNFNLQNGAIYRTSTQAPLTNVPAIPIYSFDTGNTEILVEQTQSRSMVPGKYGNFTARSNTTVNFAAGDYYFRNFYTDSHVNMNFSPGTRIWISGDLRIGNDNKLMHPGRVGDLFVYAGGNTVIETNVAAHLVLVSPNTSVFISTGTHIYGYVIGKSINVQPNVIIE